jgi:hypothetical protein
LTTLLTAFSLETIKVAKEKSKRKGYLGEVAKAAPFAVATAIADVPKGWVDSAVDQAITKVPKELKEPTWKRAVGRGSGRLVAGLATSPVFLSGIKDLQSKEPDRKKKGMAKVVGSGLVYSTLKGGIEAKIAPGDVAEAVGKKARKGNWKTVVETAGTRGALGVGAAALTAAAVAKATSKPKRRKGAKKPKKKSFLKKYVAPAAMGAAIGAGKGGIEGAIKSGRTPLKILGKAGGRAAAGALGATAMAEGVRRFMPKTAASNEGLPPTPGELYGHVSTWSGNQKTPNILREYNSLRSDLGERSPSSRAAVYAMHDELSRRGQRIPGPSMRDRVIPRSKPTTRADLATIAAVIAAPTLVFTAVQAIPPKAKDLVLEDALDSLYLQKKFTRRVAEENMFGVAQSSYQPGTNIISLAARGKAHPEATAHELGHAMAGKLRKATIGAPSAIMASRIGSAMSVALPLSVINSSRDASFTTPQDLEARARFLKRIGVVAAMLQAPILAEEAAASHTALKLMEHAGAGKKEALRRGVRHLLPAFATYAAPIAAPFIAARILKRKARRSRG